MRKDIHTYVTAIYIALVGLILLAIAVSPSKVVDFILFFSLLGLMGIELIFEGIQGLKHKHMMVIMMIVANSFFPRRKGKTAVFFGAIFLLLGLILLSAALLGVLSLF